MRFPQEGTPPCGRAQHRRPSPSGGRPRPREQSGGGRRGLGNRVVPGIRGTFLLTVTLDEVYQPGGCSETSPALAQTIVITGSGTVATG
jgi:hypothetical protein